jgi:ketosteroid isomerase-like protein
VSDEDLIVAAVHDYFDGWFDGDADRMRRALHPDLVKRSPGPDQESALDFITADQMIGWTADGAGRRVAAGLTDRGIEVDVLDVSGDIASVRVRSEPYHEYLHLVRAGDGWKIANALWRDN